MSKKDEKESIKQKETKQEIDKENHAQKTSEEKKLENENPEKLKKLEAEIANLKNDKLRLVAELENERKGLRRQMEQMYKYSNKKLVSWVLDFFVDLEEKALKAMRADPEGKIKNHLLGIEMMRNILWKNLENEGVKEIKIEAGKDRWSSRLHELVEEIENDNLPEGTITEVFEKGYLLADQVLRPAKVIISKKAAKNKNDEQNQENKN